ncbi:MAG: hypothetical protein EZS28_041815 [Streblomastix strix]|uniref:SPRY domain-containing protein n=1 Tax=Streblomastix strix TaxID=222440 RepID=A0A5J4TX36_9EUKA|nr:MAG: hypothetical protein EZS28_041815 [Streblomastix strix]
MKKKTKVSCPKDWIIKLQDYRNTLVLLNQEINSGVWAFTAKCRRVKYEIGIGIIDARQKVIPHPFDYKQTFNNSCNELKWGDEVSVIVDLQSNPHTFCLAINKVLQPFCVTNIPDRLKFILFFGGLDSEWEFISLQELAQAVDLSKIEERRRFKYE